MKFLSFGPKTQTVVVADIDGGSAGVALIHVRSGSPAEVVAAHRVTLPHEERDAQQAVTQILQALRSAAEKTAALYVKTEKPQAVRKAYAIVHPPWTHSKTVVREAWYEKETVVDTSAISGLAREALAERDGLDANNLIEASIIRTELNGYPTAEPKGKRAEHLRVCVLMSDCDPTLRAGVPEALGASFATPTAILRSSARALLGVANRGAHPSDRLVVSVTGNATECVVVCEGAITDQAVIHEGLRSIIERVAAGKMPEEVQALLRMAAGDACTNAECEALNRSLAAFEPELVKKFGEIFGKLAARKKLPNTLVLSAHPDAMPWFVQFFAKIDFGQFTRTSRPFDVEKLEADLTSDLSYAPGVAPDAGLAAASVLVNTELGVSA